MLGCRAAPACSDGLDQRAVVKFLLHRSRSRRRRRRPEAARRSAWAGTAHPPASASPFSCCMRPRCRCWRCSRGNCARTRQRGPRGVPRGGPAEGGPLEDRSAGCWRACVRWRQAALVSARRRSGGELGKPRAAVPWRSRCSGGRGRGCATGRRV